MNDGSQGTVVEETQVGEQGNNGMGEQRQKVSYKDICMNFNGGNQEDHATENDWWYTVDDEEDLNDHMEDGINGKDDSDESAESLFLPVAKVTKEDIKEACIPWKRA
ncbi:hypothetical protein A2U01_0063490, partial [Trifolium medium]|nr:hypothetical protein [Trifolium medium]